MEGGFWEIGALFVGRSNLGSFLQVCSSVAIDPVLDSELQHLPNWVHFTNLCWLTEHCHSMLSYSICPSI